MNPVEFRVLIIDDSAEDRDRVRRFLLCDARGRYVFSEADTGARGVAACLDGAVRPDCVILDLDLPDMSGLEVLEELKATVGDLPLPVILLIASETQMNEARAALRAGAQDYLGKSWMTPEALCRAVAKAVERFGLTQRLQASETRLRLALSAAEAGVWDWDIGSGVIVWSPENYRLYGMDPARSPLGYSDWERRLHPDDVESVRVTVRTALEHLDRDLRVEFRVLHPERGLRWLLALGRVERGPDGTPRRLSGINIDITERKQMEERLREADRRKDEFLAMLAHELRNPLAPIRNAVEILRLLSPMEPKLQWVRDVIERQVKHLARLVDDLLDVSCILRGKIGLHKEPLELTDVVQHAVETSRPLIETRHHTLNIILPPRPVRLEGDLTRLAQAVANLLNNAAKYTDLGGRIDLTAAESDGEVVLKIRDTGAGIPPALLPQIFDLFTQAERSLDRTQGGLGIGLTVVKNVIELHGGTVSVSSEGTGKGSEFSIRLPTLAAGAGEGAADVTRLVPADQSGWRILVVDDNIDAAESVALLLRLGGHLVRTVYSGPAALAATAEFQPQVILLDIGLPGMDGYEVARRLRATPAYRDIRLVALTGYGQSEDRERSRAVGFDQHLVKPVDPDLLYQAVEAGGRGTATDRP